MNFASLLLFFPSVGVWDMDDSSHDEMNEMNAMKWIGVLETPWDDLYQSLA